MELLAAGPGLWYQSALMTFPTSHKKWRPVFLLKLMVKGTKGDLFPYKADGKGQKWRPVFLEKLMVKVKSAGKFSW
jgi:hypothetical protein